MYHPWPSGFSSKITSCKLGYSSILVIPNTITPFPSGDVAIFTPVIGKGKGGPVDKCLGILNLIFFCGKA